MIQIRNVPDALHRELVRRARRRRQTLSAYLQDVLEREVEGGEAEEIFEAVRRAPGVKLARPFALEVREERAGAEGPSPCDA